MEMNTRQARVIDPILSKIAVGYKNNLMVGTALFPAVPVQSSGGKVIEFGKEAFKKYNLRRADGARTTRVSFGYEGKSYALSESSVEATVGRRQLRDANVVPGVDLAQKSITGVQEIIALDLEIEQAAVALDKDNYAADQVKTLTGTEKWSSPESKPLDDIEEGKEKIRAKIGRRPNVLLLSAVAWSLLKKHPTVVARFKNVDSAVTVEMFKTIVEIDRIVIGEAIYVDKNDKVRDVWGDVAILGYVPATVTSDAVPSYGYTYQMENCPFVEEPYYEKQTKSYVYGVTDERVPVLCCKDAGYLITGTA